MNRSSVAFNSQYQAFPSGDHIFMLKPVETLKKCKHLDVEINMNSFLNIKERDPLELFVQSKEDITICRLFGLPHGQSLVDALESTKTPQNSMKSDLPKQQGGSQSVFYAAVPSTNKCLVCKETFENYLQHISTAAHKKREKTYITTSQKLKVSLDSVIFDLISSIKKLQVKPSTIGRLQIPQKRQRVKGNFDLSQVDSLPKKRKILEDGTPVCASSLQSTSLINSNCLARKESFFE